MQGTSYLSMCAAREEIRGRRQAGVIGIFIGTAVDAGSLPNVNLRRGFRFVRVAF